MKQNIAIEQLKELNKNQLKKLYELVRCNPFVYNIAYDGKYNLKSTQQDYIEADVHITLEDVMKENVELRNKYNKIIDHLNNNKMEVI